MEILMSVKEYQNLPINEPKEIKEDEMFRPKVDYERIEAGKIVPVYKIIKVNLESGNYEYLPKFVRLI